MKNEHLQYKKHPQKKQKQLTARGIKSGQWYRLVFQFPIGVILPSNSGHAAK
ncbi:hypothetical protein V4375_003643 [Escherichia coli]